MNKTKLYRLIIISVALILVFSLTSAVFANDNELPGDVFEQDDQTNLSGSEDSKKSNTITISNSKKTYKRSNLKSKKTYTVKVTKANGKVTCRLSSEAKSAGIKIKKLSHKTSGKGKSAKVTAQYRITVPKKCKKGTYKITLKAAGNDCYKAGEKTLKIKVK